MAHRRNPRPKAQSFWPCDPSSSKKEVRGQKRMSVAVIANLAPSYTTALITLKASAYSQPF